MEPRGARPPTDIPFFHEVAGVIPYPWQCRLYQQLTSGQAPEALDIPTGLGKTTVVLLYLLAIAHGAPLPRRLAYVVDRRAIVDQTATAIHTWVERITALPELAARFRRLNAFANPVPIAIGVLRGGLADDGEWRVDPARPAVVVGTVDMVGSRLLFSGYGDGLSRRPYHAGLLGHDTFLLLDEAHLSPGMAGLVRDLQKLGQDGARPGFRALTLSATPDTGPNNFCLDEDDLAHPLIKRRLTAPKQLELVPVDDNSRRVDRMVDLAHGFGAGAILIYVRRVRDARKVFEKLAKQVGDRRNERVGLLTGTLRGAEREALTSSALWEAFDPMREPQPGAAPHFLICTSAGEVGVDLHADHAVMDLSTLDAMTQRLGRVNRTGQSASRVYVVYTAKEAEAPKNSAQARYPERLADAVHHAYRVLSQLSDGSPLALRGISTEDRLTATAPRAEPVPLHPQTVECLAATTASVETPPIGLFLRGLSDEPEVPDVYLVWRWDTPHLVQTGPLAAAEAVSLFRPEPREVARVPAGEAQELLSEALSRRSPLPLIIRSSRGEVLALELEDVSELPDLSYATVFLPCDAGGLRAGLPDPMSGDEVGDVGDSETRLRRIVGEADSPDLPPWTARGTSLRIPLHDPDNDTAAERWIVYALRHYDPSLTDGDSDLTRLAAAPQTLGEHAQRVAAAARQVGAALELPPEMTEALEIAGNWHDSGKQRARWQRAAGIAGNGPPLAKSPDGKFRPRALGGYRHEFGSLADAERALSPGSATDLALHLVAAHHGRGRPGFPDPRQWDPDLPADLAEDAAVRVAERFGRLQAHYGPWQLAWLESLLKAADAWVSANRDA